MNTLLSTAEKRKRKLFIKAASRQYQIEGGMYVWQCKLMETMIIPELTMQKG